MDNYLRFPAIPQQIVDFIGEAVHKEAKVMVSYSDHTGETINWSDIKFNPHPSNGCPLKILSSYYLPSGEGNEDLNKSKKSLIGLKLTFNKWR